MMIMRILPLGPPSALIPHRRTGRVSITTPVLTIWVNGPHDLRRQIWHFSMAYTYII
jgi:hypothetical protein